MWVLHDFQRKASKDVIEPPFHNRDAHSGFCIDDEINTPVNWSFETNVERQLQIIRIKRKGLIQEFKEKENKVQLTFIKLVRGIMYT